MGKETTKVKERKAVVELVTKAIMSGFCDRNLSAIRKTAEDAIPSSETLDWDEACDLIRRSGISCGKSKFYELVTAGVILKMDCNTYSTRSVIDFINSQK